MSEDPVKKVDEEGPVCTCSISASNTIVSWALLLHKLGGELMVSTAFKDSHLRVGPGLASGWWHRTVQAVVFSFGASSRNLDFLGRKKLFCLSFPPAQLLLLTAEDTTFRARLPPQAICLPCTSNSMNVCFLHLLILPAPRGLVRHHSRLTGPYCH